MDVMQTKGSRQIGRVPSEDAVAPTSGEKSKCLGPCPSFFRDTKKNGKKAFVTKRDIAQIGTVMPARENPTV